MSCGGAFVVTSAAASAARPLARWPAGPPGKHAYPGYRLAGRAPELTKHRDVVTHCVVPDHLAVPQVEHMDLLEVDLPSGGRHDLVHGAVLEQHERAAVCITSAARARIPGFEHSEEPGGGILDGHSHDADAPSGDVLRQPGAVRRPSSRDTGATGRVTHSPQGAIVITSIAP
ncbi:hypothetical protein [Streptomyces adustus]|uniref:hypothetical protein n=1 Tax=Streptomyces adustus TaxID=1609272 RepID=UPI0012E063D2|nr:hypothetical protein [Streptomyces adustus]